VKFYHCIPEAKRGRGRPYEGKEQFWIQTLRFKQSN
jgi:hypothetical protein